MPVKLHGIGRIKRYIDEMTACFRSQVTVLAYHRIFEPESDPHLLCVSRKHFAEHLEHLRRYYRVMSLTDLVALLKGGEL